MKKLETREDVELLVNEFYRKVVKDDQIGLFFTEIKEVDWDLHLPKMYAFWETIIFGQMTYKGNPMAVHFPVNSLKAMEKHHFERWLKLWRETVEAHFAGRDADAAITKSENIAALMSYKMEAARKPR